MLQAFSYQRACARNVNRRCYCGVDGHVPDWVIRDLDAIAASATLLDARQTTASLLVDNILEQSY